MNIPSGSKNIQITNNNIFNFLAIKNKENIYYLNGDFTVENNIMGKIEGKKELTLLSKNHDLKYFTYNLVSKEVTFIYQTNKNEEVVNIKDKIPVEIEIEVILNSKI